MLLMHGPAPGENRNVLYRSQQERGSTTNEKRMEPLACSSPVQELTPPSSKIQSPVELWKSPTAVRRAFRPLQVVKHTKYSVALSHWHSLSDFFVQLGIHSKLLNELTDQLLKAFEYNFSHQRTARSKSPMCMAKWEGDENWYRAELLDSEGLVLFVDFGNLAVIRRPEALHDIPEVALLTDTEALAIRCCLSGLRMLPGVNDVNELSHPDGQSLGDWFQSCALACDIIFTGNVLDETYEVVLVQRADGQLLSERIADRYPHAFALMESAISVSQSLAAAECDASAAKSPSPADQAKPMSPSDSGRRSSLTGIEAEGQNSVCWQFTANDFVDARITHLHPIKLDMAFVQPEHLMEKQVAVTVACRQECLVAPVPHASAFIPGAKFIYQDPHDKDWYRAILIKPKPDEGVMYKLFLMDVGRFETFQPSQVREMPACLVDVGPLAMCVQVRRRPLQLAVNDHVILVLVTVDAIPVVDVFLDYNDYLTAKKNTERSNPHGPLKSNSNSSHIPSSMDRTHIRKQDFEPFSNNDMTERGNSTSERFGGTIRNQPSLRSKPKEAPVVAKIAHMGAAEQKAIIRPAQSTILARNTEPKNGECPTTAAITDNGNDVASSSGGTDSETASTGWVPVKMPLNDSVLKTIGNDDATTVEETTKTKTLSVPQLTLSNGDSLLVHLEIESLINDPHNFVLIKDCGLEFPLLLDEMNSREKTPMSDVRVGDHCVLVDRSGRMAQYHRVEVVETNEKRSAKVHRLDHGGTLVDVCSSELFELVLDDVRLPRIAIRSRLSADHYNLADWDSQEVRQCLRKYALMSSCRQHLLLRAQIVAFNGGVATVQLYTRNDSSDLITEALCSARQKRITAERAAANASPKKAPPNSS